MAKQQAVFHGLGVLKKVFNVFNFKVFGKKEYSENKEKFNIR